MKPVPAYTLAHSRREARQDARAAIEFKAARERALKRSNDARSVFRNVVVSLDLPMFQADAVIAAAECMAKADVVAAGMPEPFHAPAIAPSAPSPPPARSSVLDDKLFAHKIMTDEVRLVDLRRAAAPDVATIDWLENDLKSRRASLSKLPTKAEPARDLDGAR